MSNTDSADGYGVNFEQSFDRILAGLDYTDFSNDERTDIYAESVHKANHDNLGIKLGYRLVDGPWLKLDSSYLYNQLSFEDVENPPPFTVEMELMAVELKATLAICDQLTAELAYARSISASATMEDKDLTDESYSARDALLRYNFTENYAGCLGYRSTEYNYYVNSYWLSGDSSYKMDGWYVGIKLSF